jgi:hypothetical protein
MLLYATCASLFIVMVPSLLEIAVMPGIAAALIVLAVW